MSILKDFWNEQRGSGLQTLAISAAVIALASVAASSALDKFAQAGGFPTIAFIASNTLAHSAGAGKTPVFTNVDNSSTASVDRPVAAGPCPGKQRN